MKRLLILAVLIGSGWSTSAQADVIGQTYTAFLVSGGTTTPAVIEFSNQATFTWSPDGGTELTGYYVQTSNSALLLTFMEEENRIGTGTGVSLDLPFGPLTLSVLFGGATINDQTTGFYGYTYSIGSLPIRKGGKAKN